MCRAGCTCIFLSYTHLAHLVCYFPYYIGKLTAHYCIALHLQSASLQPIPCLCRAVPCAVPVCLYGQIRFHQSVPCPYSEVLLCPQKRKNLPMSGCGFLPWLHFCYTAKQCCHDFTAPAAGIFNSLSAQNSRKKSAACCNDRLHDAATRPLYWLVFCCSDDFYFAGS